jgi:hypothetical protein
MKTNTIGRQFSSIKTVYQTLQATIFGFLLLCLGGRGMFNDRIEERIEEAYFGIAAPLIERLTGDKV